MNPQPFHPGGAAAPDRPDRILPMRNIVQPYAWGSRTAIAGLLGLPSPSPEPQAELWMGAHPQAPSEVWTGTRWEPLPERIRRDPEAMLGRRTAARFEATLPFLFKVLAADRPLSIQAHPDARRARAGFAREEAAGIPRGDPRRTYRDPYPKPEALSALQPFHALAGFRPIPGVLERLAQVSLDSLYPALEGLRRRPGPEALRVLFHALVSLPPAERARAVEAAVRWAQQPSGNEPQAVERTWVLRLAREYPQDPGVLAPLVLNLLRLEPGETIYLRPGLPHAYLEGVGIELMANSDNVVRGGLTSKTVDAAELTAILDFEPGPPQRLAGKPLPEGGTEWPTPAEEFRLARLDIRPDRPCESPAEHGVQILLCVEGEATVRAPGRGDAIPLPKGSSLFVPAAAGPFRIEGRAALYRASVPGGA